MKIHILVRTKNLRISLLGYDVGNVMEKGRKSMILTQCNLCIPCFKSSRTSDNLA